jgi:hypothetical protein
MVKTSTGLAWERTTYGAITRFRVALLVVSGSLDRVHNERPGFVRPEAVNKLTDSKPTSHIGRVMLFRIGTQKVKKVQSAISGFCQTIKVAKRGRKS